MKLVKFGNNNSLLWSLPHFITFYGIICDTFCKFSWEVFPNDEKGGKRRSRGASWNEPLNSSFDCFLFQYSLIPSLHQRQWQTPIRQNHYGREPGSTMVQPDDDEDNVIAQWWPSGSSAQGIGTPLMMCRTHQQHKASSDDAHGSLTTHVAHQQQVHPNKDMYGPSQGIWPQECLSTWLSPSMTYW